MCDLKLYGRDEKEINTCVKTTKLVTNAIGMWFGRCIDKCSTLGLKRRKELLYEVLILGEGVVINKADVESGCIDILEL